MLNDRHATAVEAAPIKVPRAIPEADITALPLQPVRGHTVEFQRLDMGERPRHHSPGCYEMAACVPTFSTIRSPSTK